ncbi:hypothetical protein E4U43_002382 [Claviceps pusilla]|uniref:F-box domain-containing protein n=1 Tax=Claviceps pusilla TaxID=123648 RepID=A0A9P7N6Y4_9HYPO|nr:hypothetical protein E4U43_002382 [Claviceps pusilla]
MSRLVKLQNARHQWHCARGLSRDESKKPLSEDERVRAHQEMVKYMEMTYFGHYNVYKELKTLDRSLYRHFELRSPESERIVTTPRSPLAMATWPNERDAAKLSRLERLPVELVTRIVSVLDLAAVYSFRAASRRAFEIVDAHPQVGLLIHEAQQIIRGFFAIKLAHTVTVEELITSLQERRCVECGDFGGYMYMFTLERVCAWCVERTDRFSVVRERDALTEFGLSLDELESMPCLESFPHNVFGDGPNEGLYLPLFDRATIINAANAHAESDGSEQVSMKKLDPNILQSYENRIEEREREHDEKRFRKRREDVLKRMARTQKKHARHELRRLEFQRKVEEKRAAGETDTVSHDDGYYSTDDERDYWPEMEPGMAALRYYERPKKKALEPLEVALPKVLQKAKEDRKRFEEDRRRDASGTSGAADHESGPEDRCLMAVHRVPWLNMETRTAEWGFHCAVCLELVVIGRLHRSSTETRKAKYFRREFLVSTFEEHLDEFDPLRNGRHKLEACFTHGNCGEEPRPSYGSCRICSGIDRKNIDHQYYWLS